MEEAEKKKAKNYQRNQRKIESRKNKSSNKVDRFDPYSSSSRRLIQMTDSKRSRPSSGESNGSSSSSSSNRRTDTDVGSGATPVPILGTPLPASSAAAQTDLQLLIMKTDTTALSRDDVFTIQAVVASAEIKFLETTCTNPYDILKSKRDRYGRGYVLTCNSEEALWFYQAAIENCDDLPQDH